MDLKFIYERQLAARDARDMVAALADELWWGLDPRDRGRVDVNENPAVIAKRAEADALALEVAALRDEVGGRVYRVATAKLGALNERIEKLNKRGAKLAAKYGAETAAITLTVSDETEQVVRRVPRAITDAVAASLYAVEGIREYDEEIVDYTYAILAGETPMLPGWVFVATLDHEAGDENTGVRRAPVGPFLRGKIGADKADAVEQIDLARYRHAGPDCDHCGLDRRRKQTYVLYELATGKLRQVGTNCMRDYTGANDPERVAAWAEWLEALDRDLSVGGEYEEVGIGGGRRATATAEYLTHVAAIIREDGWISRWTKDAYGEVERNAYATADRAHDNIRDYGKMQRGQQLYVTVIEADEAEAAAALDWVREDLGAREDELDEYQHNLVTYCRGDYLPAKGDGFVASAIMARRRAVERKLEAERQADSEWFGNVKDRVKLTVTVTFTREFENRYGVRVLTKGYTAEGNGIVWWGAGGLEQGKTYVLTATVKKHETDSYNDGAKVTQITNVRNPVEVEDGDGAEMEVTKTAAERDAERLKRLDPETLRAKLDSAIASRNDYARALDEELREGHRTGYYADHYREQIARLERLIAGLEDDLAKLNGKPTAEDRQRVAEEFDATITGDERAAYSGFVAYGLSMSDGYYGPLDLASFVKALRQNPERELASNDCAPEVKERLLAHYGAGGGEG